MRRNLCRRTYKVSFVTPAFLGGADQSAQWRVPPFKALLRQWWRIVWWNAQPSASRSVAALRSQEDSWFGSSAENDTGASRIRLRINDWRGKALEPKQFNEIQFGAVYHHEISRNVSASLYLGYGPISWNRQARSAQLQRKSALPGDDARELKLAYPLEDKDMDSQIQEAMRLMALFGCLGGRSRNGWGSLMIQHGEDPNGAQPLFDEAVLDEGNLEARDWLCAVAAPWTDALAQDWCHALGCDEEGLLLWRTEPKNQWQEVMEQFAKIKIGFRTQFHFKGAGPHTSLCDRQILAYPVTNHSLGVWGNRERSANQLLFKVLKVSAVFQGIIVHLPHSIPEPLKRAVHGQLTDAQLQKKEQNVWSKVHQYLDNASISGLVRLP